MSNNVYNLNEKHQVLNFEEDTFLAYFELRSRTWAPTTLWYRYSMLKSLMQIERNLNIENPRLTAFLKRENTGYETKKSSVLTRKNVIKS